MPKLSIINSLRRRWKYSIPSNILETGYLLNVKEGEATIVTYTSAADKMKVFSAYIRQGLENGDSVSYTYPDEESETVRAKLREHGINVEKYERESILILKNLTEYFMSNGKLDFEKSILSGLNYWDWAKKKRYKHARSIEDVGDFSFVNGQWQKWIRDYWLDPRWNDPNVSKWVESKAPVGVVYDPFIMEITAINVEHMTELQINELLKAFGRGSSVSARFIDLLEDMNLFSKSIDLVHKQLVGRKFLLEFAPVSDYEKVVDCLAKESMANVEPFFVFTSSINPLHAHLAEQPAVKFFLTSVSTSIPTSVGGNKVFLPAKNPPLILDAVSKILETYADTNVCFVFDILSDLLTSIGQEKTFIFLSHALDLLSSEKITSLFLLNATAHEPQVVSQLRTLFGNQLTYDKNGLKSVKLLNLQRKRQ